MVQLLDEVPNIALSPLYINLCVHSRALYTFLTSLLMILQTLLLSVPVLALKLGNSHDSICDAANTVTEGILDYYDGLRYGGTVGMVVEPYYWWQAGEMFGLLLGFVEACGNDTVKELVHTAMSLQLGEDYNLMVSNYSSSEGNDDQGVWSLTIMEAAEAKFEEPEGTLWADAAKNTFWTMFNRWDSECQGGIRWQIFPDNNNGYSYKNTISNGALFTLAARLGKLNDDKSYFYMADFIFSWMLDIGFIKENDDEMVVYDGGSSENGCKDVGTDHWSYNYGILLMGSAYLANATGEETWTLRTLKLFHLAKGLFFDDGVIYEQQCLDLKTGKSTCNNDQRSFRAILLRSLARTAQLVPSLESEISGLLQSSADAAAKSCLGGSDGHTCGLNWSEGKWDGMYGLGEQLSALEAFVALA